MIKALSPYYITTPFVTPIGGIFPAGSICDKYTLYIYIWKGDRITDVPSQSTYEITINNPTDSDGDSKVNINRLIKDYLTFEPLTLTGGTGLRDSDNQIWIRTYVSYYVEGSFIDEQFHTSTKLMLLGYGYGMSGENPDTPSNKILMDSSIDYTMPTDGTFIVPIELDEPTPPTPEIVITGITSLGSNEYEITFTSVGTYEIFLLTSLVSGIGSGVYMSGTTSPQTVIILQSTPFEAIMTGYDSTSDTNVTSNTYTYPP